MLTFILVLTYFLGCGAALYFGVYFYRLGFKEGMGYERHGVIPNLSEEQGSEMIGDEEIESILNYQANEEIKV
jgi:hypothetical protein